MEYHLVVSVLFASVFVHVHSLSVKTEVGTIEGLRETRGKSVVHKYRGIPYAEAPVRFKPPVPKKNFRSLFYAKEFGPVCIQHPDGLKFSFTREPINRNMSEDCLSLNIYVPGDGEKRKAVMVWVYGGGFLTGAGQLYDGTKMAALGDVIIVTFNYRTGIFGFFTTGDGNAPGNYGLKDQQLALKWVKRNIAAFGGDPNRITIFGESAGASSVTWLMLAPSNQGLFQRVIAQSGVASNPWAFPDPEVTRLYTEHLKKRLGCNGPNWDVVSCLQKKPVLAFGHGSTWDWPFKNVPATGARTPSGPRVDGTFISSSPTCSSPGSRLQDNHLFRSVDLLLGANKFEGEPMLSYFIALWYMVLRQNLHNGVSKAAFTELAKNWTDVNPSAIDGLWKWYANGKPTMPNAKELLEFYGDASYYRDMMYFANQHALGAEFTKRSTYLYSFLTVPSKVTGSLRYSVGPLSPYVKKGAIHMDEIGYLFGNATVVELEGSLSPGEKDLSDHIIKYWTNFAKTGNPNKPTTDYQWPKYSPNDYKKYLEFNIVNQTLSRQMRSTFRLQYMPRWVDLKQRLQLRCYPRVSGANSIRSRDLSILSSLLLMAAAATKM